ncbi:MAG: hypothetical protein ACRDJ5_05405 [Actinomycetota bacterium]
MRILVVCTGNLCRSPMATALLRHEITTRECNDVEVVSAGTWAAGGSPATSEAVRVLSDRGIDLSPHRSRPLEAEEARSSDLIVAMTSVHVREVLELAPEAAPRIVLLKELCEMHPDQVPGDATRRDRLGALLAAARPALRRDLDVDDPMGLPAGAYERCAGDLERGVQALVKALCPT